MWLKEMLTTARLYSRTIKEDTAKRVAKRLAEDGGILFIFLPLSDGETEISVREDRKEFLDNMIVDSDMEFLIMK
jgi:hypothetical protein